MKKRGVFVVAGGSRGLSRAMATQARKAGFPIALIARNEGDLQEAKKEIEQAIASPEEVSIHRADLTLEDQVQSAFGEIHKIHGSIDVLVNNVATWTGGKTIAELSKQDVQRSLDLNFFTAFNATQATLASRKNTGTLDNLRIICIGATSSLQGWEDVFAFCVGKGALRIFAQSLARELQPQGVHVSHIVIDGLIDNTRTRHINPNLSKDQFMKMESIAKTVLHVALQEKSCWTFELDMRPYNENW